MVEGERDNLKMGGEGATFFGNPVSKSAEGKIKKNEGKNYTLGNKGKWQQKEKDCDVRGLVVRELRLKNPNCTGS